LELKCPNKGDVHEWLDSLCVCREELAQVGVGIDEKDYHSTIILSLPIYLASFASSQLAAARLYSPTKSIDPDNLISLISEEYERQRNSHSRRSGFPSSKTQEPDEAMAVYTPGSSNKLKGGNTSRACKPPVCWNCGETGHIRPK